MLQVGAALSQYVDAFMPIQVAAAPGDRERLRVWLRRLEDDRSTLFLYFPLTATYPGSEPEIAEIRPRIRNFKP